jgi:hypothetical protein
MADYTIPLTAEDQIFSVSLGGTKYQLTVRWNDSDEGGWVLDIALPDNGGDILTGIPLVTGCDLLAPFDYLGINGGLVVYADGSDLPPTVANLGDGVDLVFITSGAA